MNLRTFLTHTLALATALALPHALDAADDAKTVAMLKSENLGGLKLDLAEKAVLEKLGKPEKQGKVVLQGADGMYVQDWSYPSQGLSLTMSSSKKNVAKTIASFSASAGSKLATAKGIAVGSPVSAVRKAYGAFENKEESKPATFVAGSIYGGILFDIKGGKVSRIFFGAAAE